MMVCAACLKRGGKTWNGDDPKCAFTSGAFSRDNWNCAGLNVIRELGYEYGPRHPRVLRNRHDDESYASFDLADIELPSGPAQTLWVSWYKNRGRTDSMWLLYTSESPRTPTEADCAAIAMAFADMASSSAPTER